MNAPKILIIDDDKDQRAGLQVRLRAHGYEVVAAGDAVQAIAMARKEKPDLALLDIGLPGGDGHMVLERLRSMMPTSALPVIVLSAREPDAHRNRMLAAGAVAYFQKPADNAALLDAIRQALGEPPKTDSQAPAAVRPTALIRPA